MSKSDGCEKKRVPEYMKFLSKIDKKNAKNLSKISRNGAQERSERGLGSEWVKGRAHKDEIRSFWAPLG
jgi:hypothetical protein